MATPRVKYREDIINLLSGVGNVTPKPVKTYILGGAALVLRKDNQGRDGPRQAG